MNFVCISMSVPDMKVITMTIDIFELIRQKCPGGVLLVAIRDLGKFEHGVGLDKSMLRSEIDVIVAGLWQGRNGGKV